MTIVNTISDGPTTNTRLLAWVDEVIDMCNPDSVHWCDGSQEEYDKLAQFMTETGTARWLEEEPTPQQSLRAVGAG